MADELTERIIGAATEVHRVLGPGLLESVCEAALCHEFELRGISFRRQVPVDVVYKNIRIQGQKLDLIVEAEVVVEVKSLQKVPEVAEAQILSYLRASSLRRGLLINFGERLLINGIRRYSL